MNAGCMNLNNHDELSIFAYVILECTLGKFFESTLSTK